GGTARGPSGPPTPPVQCRVMDATPSDSSPPAAHSDPQATGLAELPEGLPEGFTLDAAVEAILLTTERPLAPAKVAEAVAPWLQGWRVADPPHSGEAEDPAAEIAAAVERLNAD